MARTRGQKIANLAKRTFGGRKITEQEADQLFEKYAAGLNQDIKGEVIAETIKRFLKEFPNVLPADSALQELHAFSNFSRFRTRALIFFMTTYYNGVVDGLAGKKLNIRGLIEQVANDVREKRLSG